MNARSIAKPKSNTVSQYRCNHMLSSSQTLPPFLLKAQPDNQNIHDGDQWSKRRVKTLPEEDRPDTRIEWT